MILRLTSLTLLRVEFALLHGLRTRMCTQNNSALAPATLVRIEYTGLILNAVCRLLVRVALHLLVQAGFCRAVR